MSRDSKHVRLLDNTLQIVDEISSSTLRTTQASVQYLVNLGYKLHKKMMVALQENEEFHTNEEVKDGKEN
ncbi:hypothetical protein OAQ99_04700 [Candidatus Kapabacteria bacterium]|nr:hypothetical protein [Candidatus Kapabacteria bacterium]